MKRRLAIVALVFAALGAASPAMAATAAPATVHPNCSWSTYCVW